MNQSNKKVMKAQDYQFYGYLNSVVSEVYEDIPIATAFPAQYRKDLHKYIFNDAFLSTSLPAVYTYIASVKGNEYPVGVFGKCARKRNAVSLSRYTQVAGWPWSKGELFRDSFESILDFGFYSEAEVDSLASGENVTSFGSSQDALLNVSAVNIHPTALKVLVYGAYRRWNNGGDVVRIAVPAEFTGDAYNAYVLGAVRTLYSYFPVGLRIKAGFTSYLPAGKNNGLDSLYFGFMPSAQASADAVYLDGSSLPVYEKMSTTVDIDTLDAFINYTISLQDPEQRATFLNELFDEVDGGDRIKSLYPFDYSEVGRTLLLLNHTGIVTHDVITQWREFCEDPQHYPASFREDLHSSIQEKLTPELFVKYLKKECLYTDAPEEFGSKCAGMVAISCETDALRECFWNYIRGYMADQRFTALEGLDFMKTWEQDLSKVQEEAFADQLETYKNQYSAEVLESALAIVNQAESVCQVLQQETERACTQANTALERALSQAEREVILEKITERGAERIVEELFRLFQPVKRLPVQNTEQITAAIQEAESLERELAMVAAPIAEPLRQQLQEFLTEKRDALNSHGVLKDEVSRKLSGITNYFEAVEHIGKAMREHPTFEPEDQESFLSEIRGLRPVKEKQYQDHFYSYCGKNLTMENLCSCEALVVSSVLQDLAAFFTAPYAMEITDDAKKMADSILYRQTQMEQFRPDQFLRVSIAGTELSANRARKILAPESDSTASYRGNNDVKRLLLDLIDAQAYRGNQMASLCNVFIRSEWKFSYVFDRAYSGRFRDAEEADYLALFETGYQALAEEGKDPVETLLKRNNWLRAEDSTARNAFKIFKKAHDRGTNGKLHPGWITSIVLGVTTAALAGASIWLWVSMKNNDAKLNEALSGAQNLNQSLSLDNQEYTDIIAQMREQLEGPADLDFLANKAKIFSRITNIAMNDQEESYSVFNDRYRAYNKDFVVARIGGEDVTWGEYFLWELYFASQVDEPLGAETFLKESVQTRVQNALLMVHGNVEFASEITGFLDEQTVVLPEAEASIYALPEQDLRGDMQQLSTVFAKAWNTTAAGTQIVSGFLSSEMDTP